MNQGILITDKATWRAQIALLSKLVEVIHSYLPDTSQTQESIDQYVEEFWDWQSLAWTFEDRELSVEETESLPSSSIYSRYFQFFMFYATEYENGTIEDTVWKLIMSSFAYMVNLIERFEYHHNKLKPTTVDSFVIEIDSEHVTRDLTAFLDLVSSSSQFNAWLSDLKDKLISTYPFNKEDRMGESIPRF